MQKYAQMSQNQKGLLVLQAAPYPLFNFHHFYYTNNHNDKKQYEQHN